MEPLPGGPQILQSAAALVEQMATSGLPVPVRRMTIASDFDGDGTVGFEDFVLFARAFGTAPGDGLYESRFDLNGSDRIDFADFVLFAGVFGQTSNS